MRIKPIMTSDLNSIKGDLNALQNRADGVDQILENVEARLRVHVAEQMRGVYDAMLRQRALLCARTPLAADVATVDLAPRADAKTLDECYAELRRLAPDAFAAWRALVDVNATTYEGHPTHSCSVAGHEMAEAFGRFLAPYLTGTVLDIGCGPQAVPVYLGGHPPGLIAGVDPLPPDDEHPFAFARTVCEFLPWPDATFDLVVVGTSLDHVLLLDRALAEIRRVLRPGGHAAMWVSFVPGAEPYDPYRAGIRPIDEHHLFHFDRPWFESMMDEHFRRVEIIPFIESTGSCFYAFETRPS